MTVRFFILYCACIWSILGTVPCCRAGFVEFSHLRAVKAGLRARGTLASERVHAKQVQEPSDREGSCRNGDAADMLCCKSQWPNGGNLGGVMSNGPRSSPRDLARLGTVERVLERKSYDLHANTILDTSSANIHHTRPSCPHIYIRIAILNCLETMAEVLCGVCNAEPKKYKCPTCALP
jgi:hypothetical protein